MEVEEVERVSDETCYNSTYIISDYLLKHNLPIPNEWYDDSMIN